MTLFKVRGLKPHPTNWVSVERNSLEDAIQDFHLNQPRWLSFVLPASESAEVGDMIYLMRVEVEGEKETFVSRLLVSTLVRKGGIAHLSFADKLNLVAKGLDWKGDPSEILSEDTWK